MTTDEVREYYAKTINREIRADLIYAVSLVETDKIVIDCGCGAGADIAYLINKGFIVYGFDIEEEAIEICRERFKYDENIFLSQDSFSSFDFPESSLVVADASLFFCTEAEFNAVWDKIYYSLTSGGIFCGSFLGPKDTMADPDRSESVYWPGILVLQESDLHALLKKFEILKFTEHTATGENPQGLPHQWHIFSVVAKKI